MKQRSDRPAGLSFAEALLGPPAVMSLYFGLSRWPTRWHTAETDWAALALSVVVGVVCLARLPVPRGARMVLAVAYVPVVGFALVMWSLYFVGVMFGDWL